MRESRPRTSSRTPRTRSTRSRARSTAATSSRRRRHTSPRESTIGELGPPVDPDALVRLDLPQPELRADRIIATILYVDSFGNVALNLTRDHVNEAGIVPGTQVELDLGGERVYAVAARTFADARPGDIMLYEDSYRNMSLAISSGNAAEMLHARIGQPVRINVGRI